MQDNTINPQAQNPPVNPVVGPPPDINPTIPTEIPPIPPSSSPRRRALIPTILGLVLLVLGVGAGVALVREQQLVRQRAGAPNNCCGVDRTCSTDYEWQQGYYACQRGECGCTGGTVPGGTGAPPSCQVQGAPCSAECNDGSTRGPDTCPGATSSNPGGTFASCNTWATQACGAAGVKSVNGTTTGTGGTGGTGGTTTSKCPSGYFYCAATSPTISFAGCIKENTFCPPTTPGEVPLCPSTGPLIYPVQPNYEGVVGAIYCASGGVDPQYYCVGGRPVYYSSGVGGYCPGFAPSSGTGGTGGTTTSTCGGSGQTCCDPFTSGGKICDSGFYCNTGTGKCETSAPANLCDPARGGSGGTLGPNCEVFKCGTQCNLGNQCNLGKQIVPCASASLEGQCGQIDFLNTSDAYCGVKEQNCGGSCAGTTGGGGTTPTQPPSTQPPGTTTPTVTAQCSTIKAYDTNWNLLTSSELSSLKAGDHVRFTVVGTTSSGTFDKARFTINGVQGPEVTAVSPGVNGAPGEFYSEYTIPEGVTSFTVTGEIHHQALNQWY